MLTIDIRLNGDIIARANLVNESGLADISDYRLEWFESAEPALGIPLSQGSAIITGHRRRQSVWALVAKATVVMLGAMARLQEAKDARR